MIEVFLVFLRLGLTSFGGPIAHIGYFRDAFVVHRRWLDDAAYADLVALCQFLPGPASSQVGAAIGFGRAGWPGAIAAWVGFTLPSALLLVAFAGGLAANPAAAGGGWVQGLKVVAVAIVAQAVWGMARTLCPDGRRVAIAIAAALVALLWDASPAQIVVIVGAGAVGHGLLRDRVSVAPSPSGDDAASRSPVSRAAARAAAALLLLGLAGLPLWAAWDDSATARLVDGTFRAGALVFGGGHVVLPLLERGTAGLVDRQTFLAGYGATQAVPGPLFSFAAYLGAVADWPLRGGFGALVLLVTIFLPGLLVLVAAWPAWHALRRRPAVRAAVAGINAAVVGLLLAALYDPVWTAAIRRREDFALTLLAFALLVFGRVSPLVVVLGGALAGGWLAA